MSGMQPNGFSVQPIAPEISFSCPFCSTRLVLRTTYAEGSCPGCQRPLRMNLMLDMPQANGFAPHPVAAPNGVIPASERFFRPSAAPKPGPRPFHPPSDWR